MLIARNLKNSVRIRMFWSSSKGKQYFFAKEVGAAVKKLCNLHCSPLLWSQMMVPRLSHSVIHVSDLEI